MIRSFGIVDTAGTVSTAGTVDLRDSLVVVIAGSLMSDSHRPEQKPSTVPIAANRRQSVRYPHKPSIIITHQSSFPSL